MTPRAPVWLTEPSRYAALSQPRARIALVALALLLLATLLALASPAAPLANPTAGDDQHDILLYETIVQGLRGGGDYYGVTGQALRTAEYPMRPFFAFRLPTLAVVEAALPLFVTMTLLYALVAGVGYVWYLRLGGVFDRPAPRLIALALLAGGLIAFTQGDLFALHEIWSGLLIALSLALRREDKWIEAVAIGLIAMLIRETAALYVCVMALFAIAEGRRREALGWAATLGVLAIVVALHAHAVAMVVRETDPAAPGLAALPGFGIFVTTMQQSTALTFAPFWLAAPLVALALFGWSAWRSALALRALAVFVAYALLLALFGRADSFYGGLMIAPTFLIGLAFAPDGLRDLIAAARGPRRKIIVTRVTR
ncbi:hypothetical protein [Sphingomonas glacialis]|uniref:DUF2029 domain-containing protein n=1 Tax=Sphingomonas glacialis TaxID=658225 RepID=A0A502FZS7_9SPHN|nr:hypothetical protein [Sphingomonas glacialis]TPG55157.1 hypothetical protein EAH76_11390 [Sphingomonas glacialis]